MLIYPVKVYTDFVHAYTVSKDHKYVIHSIQKVHALPFDFMKVNKKPILNKKKILYGS